MQNSKNNQNKNFGQQIKNAYISNAYSTVTDIAEMVHGKRVKGTTLKVEEEKYIQDEFKKIGEDLFRKVMYLVQEDMVNSVLAKEILAIAAEYGKKALGGKFDSLVETGEIIQAIVSKLTAEETKGMDKYSEGQLVRVSPENCNKILEISEDNAAVTIPERMALKKLLQRINWFKPVKKEEKAVAPVISITTAVMETTSTNGEVKDEKKAAS